MVSTLHNLVLNLIQQNRRAELGTLRSCLQLFVNRYANPLICCSLHWNISLFFNLKTVFLSYIKTEIKKYLDPILE